MINDLTNPNPMHSTMQEIENGGVPSGSRKNDLMNSIAGLEKDILMAEKEMHQTEDERSSYVQESPEQANARHRNLVFLKKNLATAKSEFEQLEN